MDSGATMLDAAVAFDNKSQLERVQSYLITGETLFAVYSCKSTIGISFAGFTDRRVILYDLGFHTNQKSMLTVPYHRIQAVVAKDEGQFMKNREITLITDAGRFVLEFIGADQAASAYRLVISRVMGLVNT